MSDLDQLVDQARSLFAEFGDVRSRKMFGGAGLYAEGVMFALIADAIYLKANGALADDFAAAGSAPFVYDGARGPTTMSYWRLPGDAGNPDAAIAWGRRALDCAKAAVTVKPRVGRRRPT